VLSLSEFILSCAPLCLFLRQVFLSLCRFARLLLPVLFSLSSLPLLFFSMLLSLPLLSLIFPQRSVPFKFAKLANGFGNFGLPGDFRVRLYFFCTILSLRVYFWRAFVFVNLVYRFWRHESRAHHVHKILSLGLLIEVMVPPDPIQPLLFMLSMALVHNAGRHGSRSFASIGIYSNTSGLR
jgi:hypothetical protein